MLEALRPNETITAGYVDVFTQTEKVKDPAMTWCSELYHSKWVPSKIKDKKVNIGEYGITLEGVVGAMLGSADGTDEGELVGELVEVMGGETDGSDVGSAWGMELGPADGVVGEKEGIEEGHNNELTWTVFEFHSALRVES